MPDTRTPTLVRAQHPGTRTILVVHQGRRGGRTGSRSRRSRARRAAQLGSWSSTVPCRWWSASACSGGSGESHGHSPSLTYAWHEWPWIAPAGADES